MTEHKECKECKERKERKACKEHGSCREHNINHIHNINDRLLMNLRDLERTMQMLYEGKGSQKRILIILRESGGMTQRALTELLGIQPGSASEVISKLEGTGLIWRRPSMADRRTMDIGLTETGMAMAEDAAQKRQQRHVEMFSCLTAEEKETLLSLMEKLNGDWDVRYRGRTEGEPPAPRYGEAETELSAARYGETEKESTAVRHGAGGEFRTGGNAQIREEDDIICGNI